MSKQTTQVTTVTASKTQLKPARTHTQKMVAARESADLLDTTEMVSFQSRDKRLGTPNLRRVQRQLMARQIGQQRGNRHLRQILARAQYTQFDHGKSNTIQRQPKKGKKLEISTIANAIALYKNSKLSATAWGQKVLAKLIELHGESEIEYEEIEAPKGFFTKGFARENKLSQLFNADIAVNEKLKTSVARTSILLVHEAGHLLLDKSYIEEELLNRSFQIDFYKELQRGIRSNGHLYRLSMGFDPNLEQQNKKKRLNQLVDYVIWLPEYRSSVTAEWVSKHIHDWGGIQNRWTYTKAKYLQVLLETNNVAYLTIVFRILESQSSVDEFRRLLKFTGKNNLNRGISMLRSYFQRSKTLYSITYWQRIKNMQISYGINLGIPKTRR